MSTQTVLLLDDDETILAPLTLIFRREGYRVLTALAAEEALAQMEHERVAVVIADQRLPSMCGVEFLRLVRERWPDTVRIMLTAYGDLATTTAAINAGHVYRYLVKPWDNEELRAVLRDSVRFYELHRENRRLMELTAAQALELRRLNSTLSQQVAAHAAELDVRNHELENNLLDVVRLLSSVQEMRHPGLAGHAERMARAARWIAADLALEAAQQYDVEIAATLHDLGRLGLPDRILHKQTFSLAREDQALERNSPLLGEALLAQIPRLRPAARIVRHQTEWFNGQGYPDGLSGKDIPLGARILSVVEAYERGSQPAELRQGEGRRYDPQVLRSLERYLAAQSEAAEEIEEVRLATAQLREGLILTRNLYTGRGLLLATTGKVVDAETLDKIRNFDRVDPIHDWVYARGQAAGTLALVPHPA